MKTLKEMIAEARLPQPFDGRLTLPELRQRVAAGATFEVVDGDLPQNCVPLARVGSDGHVSFTPERDRHDKRGVDHGTLVALVGGAPV